MPVRSYCQLVVILKFVHMLTVHNDSTMRKNGADDFRWVYFLLSKRMMS